MTETIIDRPDRQKNFRTMMALTKMQSDFVADRAAVMAPNNGDISNMTSYMFTEVSELNGHTADGMTLEKYREQEIADVVIFALGLASQLGQVPGDLYLKSICRMHSVEIPDDLFLEPTAFSDDGEEDYALIKDSIQDQIELLAQSLSTTVYDLNPAEQHRVIQRLHSVIGFSWVLLCMLKVNPYDAIREKIARNNSKHIAGLYQRAEVERPLPKGGVEVIPISYADAAMTASHIWKRMRANEAFYADLRRKREEVEVIR